MISFHLLLVSLLLIPAGGFYVLKSVLFLAAILLSFKSLTYGRGTKIYLYLLASVSFVLLYSIPTIETDSGRAHLLQLVSLFFTSTYIWWLWKAHGQFCASNVKHLIVFYSTLYAAFKIIIFLLFLFRVFDYGTIVDKIGVVGFVFQDFSWWGFPGVVRITATNDFILAMLLIIVIFICRLKLRSLSLFLIAAALIISFSRVFILLSALGLFYYLWVRNKKIIIPLFIILTPIAFYLDVFYEVFAFRFGDVTSGETKIEQTYKLFWSFVLSYGFGNGVGYSLPDYIRSTTEPFTYENHLFQLLSQIGIVGLIIVIFPYIVSVKHLAVSSQFRTYCYIAFMLFLNVTNPYLNSLTSPMLILVHFAFGYTMKEARLKLSKQDRK